MAPSTAVRYILGGLVVAGVASFVTFILPLATNDERVVLTEIARSEPVTTCLALKTVGPSGGYVTFAGSPRAAELARAHELSRSRNVTLALDAESLIDNSLKLECRDKARLSTPRFFGNLAFVQITGKRERKTVVLSKMGNHWAFVGQDIALIGIPVV
ncbi:MAG TPA: hypothetical protein VM532_15525 [Burkholderiales bacterium]|nr:hypothetical protein [Burkholderiales bacterium]